MMTEERQQVSQGDGQAGQAENLNRARHVIAVMSGKGGVGKSLVSGLLAVALRREGHQVGVLDADITGPSIPKMFFPDGAQPGASPLAILPAESRTGIKVMSINGRLPIDPDIARLCDLGRIEDYPAEAFVPIAQRLAAGAPVAHRFG